MATRTQAQERADHLQALAVLGGKLMGEDDITFSGRKFVLPEHLSLRESWNFLGQRIEEEENDTQFTRTFPYRPLDGARATALAIKEVAGFTLGKTLHSFFGRQLPQLRDVRTGPGPNDHEQVPWGAMEIPGMTGMTIHLGEGRDPELGSVFQIIAEGPRKWRFEIEGLFSLVLKYLETDSIYRGKAIDGGENFIDPYVVDPRDIIFTESVRRRLEGDLWAFLRHEKLLDSLGQGGKFAVLLEGDYGTGKSLAAIWTAQIAMECGWTFLMCRPGKDNFITLLEMARMYQPAVFFSEDLDVTAGPQSGDTIERNLDVIDGIKAKGLKLVSVFTTNHPEDIHKGMLRAGRIGAVITFGAMEREGVEQLTRRVVGDSLDPETDFDAVFNRMEGYMPAFVRAAVDRSVRYAITLNDGELGAIGTEALCLAADSLRDQHRLMSEASEDRPVDELSTAIGNTVAKVLDRTSVCDEDDGYLRYVLSTTNGS